MSQLCIYSVGIELAARFLFPMSLPSRSALALTVLATVMRPLAADDAGAELSPLTLDPIVVVATRLPRPLSAVAGQITVIDAAEIEAQMAASLDDVFRYAPGIDVETAGTRFGATGINIRGIGGNRVALRIDGVPVRDQFVIGAYSNGGRTLVEPDRIKRVEVLHGPASAMYGSRALGGVVEITTWDPDDLLAGSDRSHAGNVRAGWQGANQGWVGSGTAALAAGDHGLLAAATYRQGHELDNHAPPEAAADPQDRDSADYLLRYRWNLPGGQRLRLTAEHAETTTDTDVRSLLGYGTRFRSTTALRGHDEDRRQRLAADFEFAPGGWEQARIRAYESRYDTDQQTSELRAASARPVAIERRFLYGNDQTGFDFSLFRAWAGRSGEHRLGLGADWLRSRPDELRDGLQTSLVDGSTSKVILGESLPVRDFPVSRTDETGVWLQDEISLDDDRWRVTPALRWDRYDLQPKPDAIWREDNPDTPVVSVTESRLTPRLGVVLQASRQWSLYGQYAAGFRAPPFEDANIGFEIPLFGFRAIPNPDLRSETSDGLEFGARRITDSSQLSLTAFYTEYEDFIESRVLIGRDPESGDLIFQSRNVDQARIYGADLRWTRDLSPLARCLAGWSVDLAAFWSRGENRGSSEALNSIAPPQAVIGLAWQSADTAWDVRATTTLTAAKHSDDIDASVEDRFATPGWAVFDLSAGWRPNEALEFRAGLFNAFDERYWRWLDVAHLEAGNPMIPLLSRPGRNWSASMRISF